MGSAKPSGIFLVLIHLCLATPNSLYGKHLRIGYLEDPPDVIVDRDEQNNVVGVRGEAMEYISWLSRRLTFTYELMALEYKDRFNGLPQEFKNRSIHLGLAFFGQNAGRNQIMDLVFPAAYGDFTLIMPYPGLEINYLACILPFRLEVWYGLFSSLLVISLLLKLSTHCSGRFYPKTVATRESFKTFSVTLTYSLSIITSQGSWFSSRYKTTKIVAAIWCLAAVVLVNAYNGSLITYLLAHKAVPLVNSIEDVANRDDLRMKTMFRSLPQTVFQTQTTETYKKLANKLNRYPGDRCQFIYNSDDCVAAVKKGGFVLAASMVEAAWLLDADYKKHRNCELTLAKERYLPSYSGFVIPLNSPHDYRNTLDIHILETASFGLRQYWKSKYVPRASRCSNFNPKERKVTQLSLNDLASAFIIFVAGHLLAITAFAGELLHYSGVHSTALTKRRTLN